MLPVSPRGFVSSRASSSARRRRRARIAAVALALATAAAPANVVAQREYEVKAAFLYNFISLVEWPPAAFPSATSPFHLCVLDPDPFAGTLNETMAGETVRGRAIAIARPRSADETRGCHVLFVPAASGRGGERIVTRLEDSPVLTVGESDRFWQAGGLINLVYDGGRIRFDVNETAASARGLRISSRILQVARRVS
jgi:hypothetical protein